MSGWRRCERCRKVQQDQDYEDTAGVCRTCLTAPEPRRRVAAVARRPTAPSPDAPARSRTGAVGSGDLEARERRAKRTAWEQLAELHGEEYEQLLQVARRAEGLRA